MSRAFVRESDVVDDLPDRPVSEHPNHVTERGLEMIESAFAAAKQRYGEAQISGDRQELAQAGRDLRYWSARRTTAHLVPATLNVDGVQFGRTVTIVRDDGRQQMFSIVGEDEADPALGTISFVSPLARALMGKAIGDIVNAGKGEAEIIAIT